MKIRCFAPAAPATRSRAALTLALLAWAASAGAQTPAPMPQLTPLPQALPPFGVQAPLPPPQVLRHSLPNGLQVWVLPRNSLPRVDFVLAVRGAGLSADGPGQAGFASLLAGLMTEGTQLRDSRALALAAQGRGGAIGASAGIDGLVVSGHALASQAGAMAALVAEVARRPAYAEAEVTLAKANALEALKASQATPGYRADGALAQAVYGSHPYGNTQPSAASINAVTAEGLRAAHAQRLRPDRALLVIAGRITPELALTLARTAFGDWKASGPALPLAPPAGRSAVPQKLLLERAGSVQSALRLGRPGVPATDPDYIALKVASGVLGDGFTSRVNLNLREDKGYTYGASARSRHGAAGGSIAGGADVRNEVTGAALSEFMAEYARLGRERVGSAELQATQRYLAGSFLVASQVQGQLAGTLAGNWLLGLPPEFVGEYVSRLQQVDAAQVQAVAQKYFAPAEQSVVVVGDPAAVAEQLQPFGEFRRLAP